MRGSKTDFLYVIVATAMDKAMLRRLCDRDRSRRQGARGPLPDQPLAEQLEPRIAGRGGVAHRRRGDLPPASPVPCSAVLWRFHRIHHSMTELYWIRSAYTHPLEQLFILGAIMLPIALLGAGDQVVAVVAFLFGLSGLLQHANVDARSSVLNYVFATPEVHRAASSRRRREASPTSRRSSC